MSDASPEESRPRRGLRAIRLATAAIALLGAGYWLGATFGPHAASPQEAQALPDLGPAPAYSLTDQAGRKIGSDAFAGKVQIVTFLFPYCRTYCPLIAAHLVGLEDMLQKAHALDRVEMVAFNLAPGDAGPTKMRAFLEQYGWTPGDRHWEYLTGSDTDIRHVVTDGFHVAYDRIPDGSATDARTSGGQTPQPNVENKLADEVDPGYDISHNDAILIVDGKGRIRRIFDEADVVSNDTLWRTIRPLLAKQTS